MVVGGPGCGDFYVYDYESGFSGGTNFANNILALTLTILYLQQLPVIKTMMELQMR